MGTAGAPGPGALAALPLVGVVLGALAGACAAAVHHVAPAFTAPVAFGLTIVLTGAIHLDGFLDCCDALVASVPPERRFAILKDPRHGTFALAGVAVVVPPWLVALGAIRPTALVAALAFAAAAARFGAVLNAYRYPYGGATSAAAFSAPPPRAGLAAGAIGIVLIALAAREPVWLAAAAAAAGAGLALGRVAAGRLGGVLVGDVYGAIVTLLEPGVLVAIAVAGGG